MKTITLNVLKTGLIAGVLTLAGCKTMQQPQSPQQTQRPPSPSQSPSMPSPTQSPSMPSPSQSPSMPSPTQSPSMPSPPSGQGQPSVATRMPDMSLPSPDSPSSGEQGSPGEPQQQQSDPSQQGREQAGGDLQAAGERVARAGEQLGEDSTGPAGSSDGEPTGEMAEAGGMPEDVLIPEMDSTSNSDDLIFEESEAGGAQGDAVASGEPGGGQPSDPMSDQMQTASGDPMGGDEMSDEIRAAQEALMEAGIRLGEAGAAVADATTAEEIARARELLAEARIIVIVAGQDLMDARDSANSGDAAIFDEAEAALNEASVAIVVATQAVEGMPDFEDLQTAGLPSRGTTLEDELEESLGDFDRTILTARRTVLQPGGPGEESELPPAEGELIGGVPGGGGDEEQGLVEAEGEMEGLPEPGSVPVSRDAPVEQVAVSTEVPEDIGPGNDDDIVAQQLREAAMSESDPDLREKLWEEYRRYKSGL